MPVSRIPLYSDVAIVDTSASSNSIVARDSTGSIAVVQLNSASINNTGTELQGFTATTSVAYTITLTDRYINANAAGAAVVATLPAVAGAINRLVTIKRMNSGSNTVTLKGNGAELIDGANTYVLSAQYKAVTVQSDGAQWNVVNIV